MGKYNASPRRMGRASGAYTVVAAAWLGLLAGCAGEQSQPVEDTAATAPAEAPAADDTVSAVDDIGTATAAAGDLSLRADAPLHYTVKKGDTLWGISNYYLSDAWQWPQLWYENGQIKNPHLIYPGEVLTLVMVNGHPRVILAEDRLHPRVHELPLDEAVPAIPIDAIREFLRGPRVVGLDEADKAPYVVEFTDENIIAGQNNGVFVKNLPKNGVGTWSLIKLGKRYMDPDTKEALGYEAIPTGEADVREYGKTPDIATEMLLTKSPQEVQVGNRLLPLEAESFKADFYPHGPAKPVNARILSVYGGLELIAQYDIVAINRGSKDDIDPGTVLGIYRPARGVTDPYGADKVKLPEQKTGEVMVFKVTPRISYALVMSETRPSHVLDRLHEPSASRR